MYLYNDTTLNFDLKVIFTGILTCILVRPWLFCFDIGLPYLVHWSITMSGCAACFWWSQYDVDPYLKIKFMWFLRWLCVRVTVLFFDIVILYLASKCITIGQWHSWHMYDLDLWSQYHNYIFIMNFCLGKIVFVLWYRHTKFRFITMRQHVYVLYDFGMTLTFHLHVGG